MYITVHYIIKKEKKKKDDTLKLCGNVLCKKYALNARAL